MQSKSSINGMKRFFGKQDKERAATAAFDQCERRAAQKRFATLEVETVSPWVGPRSEIFVKRTAWTTWIQTPKKEKQGETFLKDTK